MRPRLLWSVRPDLKVTGKKRGKISPRTVIETLHVDLDVRASCQWGGGQAVGVSSHVCEDNQFKHNQKVKRD